MRTIIFSLILLFFSCNKNRTTEVSGIVIDYGSGEPIEDAHVSLRDGFINSDKSSTFTDGNGFFSVSESGEWPSHLGVSHEEYWNYENVVQGASLSTKGYSSGTKNENEIFELKAKAWFAAKIDSDVHVDSVRFKPVRDDFSLSRLFNKNLHGKGPHELTTIKPGRIAIGNTYFRYHIEYKENNGKWNSFIDSVYIKQGEVYTGTIKY